MKKRLSFIRELLEVYLREFKLVVHDQGIVIFFLFLPLAYPVIYSLIYNPEVVRDVRTVIVDHDRTPESRELVRNFGATQEAWVIGYAADLPEARRAMANHDCHAIMEIPDGFGRKLGRGEQANAELYVESSLLLRYRGLLMASNAVAMEMGAEIREQAINNFVPLASTITDGNLMEIDNIAMGNTTSGFDSFIMPGVLILILHQCIVLAVGMAGGAKRERPELAGLRSSGFQPGVAVSMLGQMLCYITILLVPVFFLIHYVPLIFQFPMEGSTWEIFCFLFPMVLACMGIGFCFQGLVREREAVFVLWVITSLAFLFLSGLTWPRYAMPDAWKWIGDLIPATWGVEGFIRMNTNGATIGQVSADYIPLWILAAVYLTAGYCVQRWVVRPSVKDGKYAYVRVRRESI